ncbi:MAG TPA: hypothetical protein PKA28_15720 [Methylomusa anaerophila]|uniref:Uncharacterized protein n=1 Tax=Methylomusa anaerophila TaxID=1930071 RepID=A0A348AHB8_9FIRM|nr:hypothetical protein [Methylomusa anaerophila]BBB90466.1 hypothetical protein MAMMFC1_01117 [Methylomusa anaerophila]HML89892.1 hypothetical protein [Methylomusa anaerophila]
MTVMTDTDKLVIEEFVAFRERLIDGLRNKHPYVLSIADNILAGKQNKMSMQIVDGGQIAGQYTFHLDGVRITNADSGKLESEIHHPFLGIVKPYVIVERNTLKNIISDEAAFSADLFAAIAKYLPEITVKFMR